MKHLGHSLNKWLDRLPKIPILVAACGFRGNLPGIASYYHFINRIIELDEKPRVKHKKKKHGKNEMPPKHPGIVQKLVGRILGGSRFNLRPERLCYKRVLLRSVCSHPSIWSLFLPLFLFPATVLVSKLARPLTGGEPASAKKLYAWQHVCGRNANGKNYCRGNNPETLA